MDRHATRLPTFALISAICLVLILQGFSVNAGTPPDETDGDHHAVWGYVYWPNGTLEVTVPIPVSITNNDTGDTGIVYVDTVDNEYENGTYRLDIASFPGGYKSTDTIYVNCTYQNMWAKNQTVVGSGPHSICDLHLITLPLGPELVNKTDGASISGFGGDVILDIPPDALDDDTIIYGTNTTSIKPGSADSIFLGPHGTVFNTPITITWSYASLDLGNLSPQSLGIYTEEKGNWTALPTTVDSDAMTVSAQVNHFSNFSLGGAAIVGYQTGLETVYRGTANVPILDLAITNLDTTNPDTLDYIHVVSNCTDNSDVTGVSLWNDTDDNTVIDGSDVQIGSTQALAGGNTNFTALGVTIPANTTLNILVAVDVSANATIDNYIDLLIPMNGVGLANAGLSIEALDPAGNVTIKQELTDPHAVYGYVSNVNGTLSSAWVNVTNNRTGTVENTMTDSLGRYEVNLGLMYEGYQDEDEIFVMANDTFGQTGWNTTVVDISMFGERCDVYIGKGPIASDETPANGSTVADVLANITVNITSTIDLDLTTVAMEVNGTLYHVGDGHLEYTNITPNLTILFFNTSSLGPWYNGQTVNVTLWQVNDTVGNPCQNAPYDWWFSVSSSFVTSSPDIRVHKQDPDINITWAPVANATSYNIYRSLAVDGTGFNFSDPLDSTTDTFYVDTGALADNSNYSYIVRGTNIAGEGPNSNIGWKLIKQLVQNAATSSINWLALPYHSELNTAQDLIDDIGASNLNYISRWVVSTQSYENKFPVGGFNWAITPGEGLLVNMKNTINYAIVGSYNASTIVDIINNPSTSSINWISLPYHSTLYFSQDLIDDIGGANINYISRWVISTQSYQNKFPIGGFNWPLTPGEPVLVNAKNTVLGYSFGPVNDP